MNFVTQFMNWLRTLGPGAQAAILPALTRASGGKVTALGSVGGWIGRNKGALLSLLSIVVANVGWDVVKRWLRSDGVREAIEKEFGLKVDDLEEELGAMVQALDPSGDKSFHGLGGVDEATKMLTISRDHIETLLSSFGTFENARAVWRALRLVESDDWSKYEQLWLNRRR